MEIRTAGRSVIRNRARGWTPKDIEELITLRYKEDISMTKIGNIVFRPEHEVSAMLRALKGLPLYEKPLERTEKEKVLNRSEKEEHAALMLFIGECKSSVLLDIAITRLRKLEEQQTQ